VNRNYIHLEYMRMYGIYRASQAEYVIHFLVAASQEYVNTDSTCRMARLLILPLLYYCCCYRYHHRHQQYRF